jgi:hypothetical protein
MEEELRELLLNYQAKISDLVSENTMLKNQISSKDIMLDALQSSLMYETTSSNSKRVARVDVVKSAKFKANDIIFKSESKGITKAVPIHYQIENKPLLVQTPVMDIPFGISTWKDKQSICLGFPDNLSCALFLKEVNMLQDRIQNCFNDKLVFVPFIKINGNYRPTMRVDIPKDTKCLAFDHTQKAMDINSCLMKGTKVRSILKCNGIWFTEIKYGMSWSLLQVRQEAPALCEYAFQDD